jgi:hypothetical protein
MPGTAANVAAGRRCRIWANRLRGAAFIVPGALGFQEGSYILLGAIVGLDPALTLALALAKRAREIEP